MHKNHLPHWQQGEAFVFATWRLADSIPQSRLSEWMELRTAWLRHHQQPWDEETEQQYHKRFSRKLDEWLDEGCGACVLKVPSTAAIVANALLHFDRERYELESYVVMPNHVHVLFRPLEKHKLEDIIKSWKGFTAREINKVLGTRGTLWQSDYWDRLIRNERHLFKCREYIRKNPIKAKLCEGQFLLFEKEHG
ncbi:transposase [Pontiella desulfatans]|nr:transposase [Pontiella desulfatans]